MQKDTVEEGSRQHMASWSMTKSLIISKVLVPAITSLRPVQTRTSIGIPRSKYATPMACPTPQTVAPDTEIRSI